MQHAAYREFTARTLPGIRIAFLSAHDVNRYDRCSCRSALMLCSLEDDSDVSRRQVER
jgi:hypothetical protein